MNERLIESWNSVVGRGDLTYVLGDLAFRNHGHFLHALNGKKILILGNHDKMPQAVLRSFTDVYGLHRFTLDKQMVVLCHYKLQVWPSSHYGSWHFYGHSHGRIEEHPDALSCDVGIDVWDYTPVPWELLKHKMLTRVPAWKERRRRLAALPQLPYDELLAPLRAENAQMREDWQAGVKPPTSASLHDDERVDYRRRREWEPHTEGI